MAPPCAAGLRPSIRLISGDNMGTIPDQVVLVTDKQLLIRGDRKLCEADSPLGEDLSVAEGPSAI